MLLRHQVLMMLVLALPLLCACPPREPDTSSLDDIADRYVQLVLAIGRHDGNYVDAYYGPAEWRDAANAEEPVPLAELTERARSLLAELRQAPPSGRCDFLEKQLVAAEAFLRILGGERMTLSAEAQALYDYEPPVKSIELFEDARRRVEQLFPGEGDLPDRVSAFRDRFVIPPDRLAPVVEAILEDSRRRTAELVALPEGEDFRYAFVEDKPWSAYNWYQGELHSLIEFNTDLPIELGRLVRTIPHEGYPGHHTYNSLLEDRLVRGRGWREFSVYPLFSPQSMLAEGTANAGVNVIMSREQLRELARGPLAELAGLEGQDFERYFELLDALGPIKYVRGEAARMLLDEGRDEAEVVDFLVRYGLQNEERARKAIDFIRTYRSYVFNYTAGEDLVRAYIGDGPDRVRRFFEVLQRPATPSELAGSNG